MVTDMLRRFVVSAVLTLPIVLFSPIGESVGFDIAPPFGLSMAWFGLILTTPWGVLGRMAVPVRGLAGGPGGARPAR